MSDKTCQHDWSTYKSFAAKAPASVRWECKTCKLNIDNHVWLNLYAAYQDGPINISIGVPDADTEEEFLKNAEKAWLEQHEEER